MSWLGTALVVMVILKLADLVDWSWWWVLAPAWAPAFASGFVLLALLVGGAYDDHRRPPV